jgi:patatin-like phospholipase/acyl hydrolase
MDPELGGRPPNRTPLATDRASAPRQFHVLALDGGGVRGIFTAAVLAGLEDDIGRPIVDQFDLVVGTSTGGVIALGLGAGLTPREILDFYVSEKDRIFPDRVGWRTIRQLFVAKYRPGRLEAAVRRIFGTTLLGESKVPLVIPAYNLGENDVYLFKTPHHPRLNRDHKVPMWAVAMATSAAPTFFPAFRLPDDHVRLVDGGVWANNPAMVGVTEAVSMFGQRPEDVRVLSLGTTSSLRTRTSRLDNGGLIRWARGPNVVDVLLTGQSAGAFAQVQHLIGTENAHRLNPPAPVELAKLDSCDATELIAKASHHSRAFSPTFDRVFGSHVPAPYVPLHRPQPKEGAHARH